MGREIPPTSPINRGFSRQATGCAGWTSRSDRSGSAGTPLIPKAAWRQVLSKRGKRRERRRSAAERAGEDFKIFNRRADLTQHRTRRDRTSAPICFKQTTRRAGGASRFSRRAPFLRESLLARKIFANLLTVVFLQPRYSVAASHTRLPAPKYVRYQGDLPGAAQRVGWGKRT